MFRPIAKPGIVVKKSYLCVVPKKKKKEAPVAKTFIGQVRLSKPLTLKEAV